MVMFAIVLMGIAMTVVSKQWTVVMKRDKEAELLFRGNRIKTAIEAYAAAYEVEKSKRTNRYPLSLDQLTQKPKRYLPVVYKDPMTGQDFELIKVGAEIRGVKSRSKEKPFDQVHFKNADTYDQIAFQVQAAAAQPSIPGQGMFNKCPPSCPQAGSPSTGRP
jgi:type II secretory pathway pseudopilin PulG